MTQLQLIIKRQNGLTVFGEYVAAFSDGTVSEILTLGTVPHDSEGPYLPIFENDDEHEIIGKLGMLRIGVKLNLAAITKLVKNH